MPANTIPKLIMKYAPDFCWISSYDLVIMLEQIYEDINPDSVCAALCSLVKEGKILKKPSPRGDARVFGYLYLRAAS